MPEAIWEEPHLSSCIRQDNWRLIWPTKSYIFDCCEKKNIRLNEIDTDTLSRFDSVRLPERDAEMDFRLFMTPEILALMEPDILCQMRTYEPSSISMKCGTSLCPPHVKSYARVYESSCDKRIEAETEPTSNCTCIELAWFLLTSACLSKGAVDQKHALPRRL